MDLYYLIQYPIRKNNNDTTSTKLIGIKSQIVKPIISFQHLNRSHQKLSVKPDRTREYGRDGCALA